MQRTLFAAAVSTSLALAGVASAADVYPAGAKDAPVYVAANTWTGFYIGANVGAGMNSHSLYNGQSNVTGFSDVPQNGIGIGSGTTSGILGGGQAGYNYQMGRFVLGIEGEIEAIGVSGHFATHTFGEAGDMSSDSRYVATLTGRLGAVFQNDTLFYLKGGVAWDELKYKFSAVNPDGPGAYPGLTDSRTGWVLGFGAEYAISRQWTVKFEYEYIDFGTKTISFAQGFGNDEVTGPFTATSDQKLNVFKAGFNYKFGGCCDYVPLK
jgi:outer membrane immunogenic protein